MKTEEDLHQRHQHLHHLLVGMPKWPLSSQRREARIAEIKAQMNMIEWVLNEN
jgi:hypothetical protein